ncbi:MAG: HEAT repeat domain-containing protein [Microcoleaceae cyanobacterium MO_207.B10]|nr:HEAT repeat domain-containing protein [Microcoleaceae cyanobacterium MO_207.B10]
MVHYKSTLFLLTSLTFFCFSPTTSRAIISYSTTGESDNRTLTKVGKLQATYKLNTPTLTVNSSLPFPIAQDSGSEATKSKNKKEKSTASNSKVPKPIRSLLKAVKGRKTLFLLSITSVFVTGTIVFILLKLFDDHQPSEDFEPEDLTSQEKIPETPSPDLQSNYPNLQSSRWPLAPKNSSLSDTENTPYPQSDNSQLSTSLAETQFASASPDAKNLEKPKYPQIDSNFSISQPENNNYQQQQTEINLSQAIDQNLEVDEPGNITLQNNYPVPQINLVEQLISDLENFDPKKRHQAIWELGQKGDSRAVQPLVNLLPDSDSKQQSLILATLSEIGTRTLKPMSRALAMSLQDDNAEVRKNAIRDLTRIYDLVIQISNILHQAETDPDPEVEKIAKWALEQLSRIRPR